MSTPADLLTLPMVSTAQSRRVETVNPQRREKVLKDINDAHALVGRLETKFEKIRAGLLALTLEED